MLHQFRETIGWQCANQQCGLYQQRVTDDQGDCSHCRQRLIPKEVLNWRFLAPALVVLVLVLAGTTYVMKALLDWRAASREQDLLAQATARFQATLQGATVSDVSTAATAVKTEFGLTEEQRLRILENSKDRIDALPHELTPEAERRLDRLFRTFYRDDVVSPQERQEIERAAREEKLAAASVETVELHVRSRTTATRRSIDRSRALLGEKRYEEARQELQRAVEEDPNDPILWANLGGIHAREERSEEARFCYNRALHLEPHLWLAHYNLGLLEERGGNRDSAIQHLKSALANLGNESPGERQSMIENILGDPDLEGLRRDARFSSLLSVNGTSRGQS